MRLDHTQKAGLLALSAAVMLSGCRSAEPAPVQTAQAVPVQTTPAQTPAQGQQGTLNPDGTFTPSPTNNGQRVVVVPARPIQQRSYQSGRDTRTAVVQPRNNRNQNSQYDNNQNSGSYSQRTEVPSGTSVAVRLTEGLSASRNSVGDGFTGILEQPVQVGNYTAFARGTRVAGTVVASKGRGRFKGAGDLAIELTSIGGNRVTTDEYEKASPGRGRRTAETVGGGAGLGAIIGGIVGGGKGAAIGAASGAGAGAVAGAYTGNRDVVIPSESVVNFTLTSPIVTR